MSVSRKLGIAVIATMFAGAVLSPPTAVDAKQRYSGAYYSYHGEYYPLFRRHAGDREYSPLFRHYAGGYGEYYRFFRRYAGGYGEYYPFFRR